MHTRRCPKYLLLLRNIRIPKGNAIREMKQVPSHLCSPGVFWGYLGGWWSPQGYSEPSGHMAAFQLLGWRNQSLEPCISLVVWVPNLDATPINTLLFVLHPSSKRRTKLSFDLLIHRLMESQEKLESTSGVKHEATGYTTALNRRPPSIGGKGWVIVKSW